MTSSHQRDERSLSKLQSVQEMNLRDDVIPDEKAWVSTVDVMVSKLNLEQVVNRAMSIRNKKRFKCVITILKSNRSTHRARSC